MLQGRMRNALLLLVTSLSCTPQTGADSAYGSENIARIELERSWHLTSSKLRATITLPANHPEVRAAVEGSEGVTIAGGETPVEISLQGLEPGEHQLVVSDDDQVLGRATFKLSAPLYVVVSTDWDDTRMSDVFLDRMDKLRERHPELKVTQFFAPYHYTDPQITDERRSHIDTWIKEQRDRYGDEIGVHVHGWCHFIQAKTNVTCNTADTFYVDDGSGYTTILAAYSVAEMTQILQASVDTFEEHGLGTPTSFRAGGWTADGGTLRALVNAGFSIDSSAVPPHRLAVWRGYELFDWNTAHWTGITETTQPYYPLESNIAKPDPERRLPILEVPDNGVLVDYVTGADMVQIYDLNHDGGILETPTLYQVGWHPPNFSEDFLARMDQALTHVDAHLHQNDRGPAVYVNISDLRTVWR